MFVCCLKNKFNVSKVILFGITLLLPVLLLQLILTQKAQAQAQNQQEKQPIKQITLPRLHNLTVSDGLPVNIGRAITQDHYGFIWIGTNIGLARYGGQKVKVFNHQPFDSTSLGSSGIQSVFVDHNGTLWVGTNSGLNRFNRKDQTFTHYRYHPSDSTGLPGQAVFTIGEGPKGILWIGTNDGIARLDLKTQMIQPVPLSNSGSNTMSVYAIKQGKKGNLYVGTSSGLFKKATDHSSFVCIYPSKKNSDVDVTGIVEGKNRQLWLATDNGLVWLNTKTNTSRTYRPGPRGASQSDVSNVAKSHTNSNILWLTTPNHLVRFNIKTLQFSTVTNHELQEISINYRNDLFVSRSGLVWFSTLRHGIYWFKPGAKEVALYKHRNGDPNSLGGSLIRGVAAAPDSILWVGTQNLSKDNGVRNFLNRINLRNGDVRRFYNRADDPGSLPAGFPWDVIVDDTGHVWVAVDNNIARYEPNKNRFKQYDPGKSGDVRVLYESQDGTIWAGTLNGLYRYDPSLDSFVHLKVASGKNIRSLEGGPGSTLFLGTISGVGIFNSSKGSIQWFTHNPADTTSLSNNMIMSLLWHKETPNVLWIGSIRGGLSRLNLKTGKFKDYLKKDGLPSNSVIGLVFDNHGNIWGSTTHGIFRFDPKTQEFLQFGRKDGLQGFMFMPNAYARNAAGELFFGGLYGLNAFYPAALINKNAVTRPPVFTNLHINRNPVEVTKNGPLQTIIEETQTIHIGPNDNRFTINFTGFPYRNPNQMRYRYRLKGANSNWVMTKYPKATFANLPPGMFTLQVQAVIPGGEWSQSAELEIVVAPPAWRTWWAYLLYSLFFVGCLYALYRLQRSRLLRKKREEDRERELEHAKEIKEAYHKLEESHEELKAAQEQLVQQEKLASLGQLTAGIAHEIKNPLNFVNNFSDVSAELIEEAREELEGTYHDTSDQKQTIKDISDILDDVEANQRKINEHGNRADGIVKSMLQHSRGKSGEKVPTDINKILDEYVNLAYHGMRATDQSFNIDIQTDFDEDIPKMDLVAQDISRAFLNIIKNGMYAAHEKAQQDGEEPASLKVQTELHDEEVEIRIRDNGPGIPDDIREKIFEPFFTTKPTGVGTGLGLSMTYDIIKMHNGTFNVETKEEEFTEFIVTLPNE